MDLEQRLLELIDLEKRISELEEEVADLKQQLEKQPIDVKKVIEEISRCFYDVQAKFPSGV